MFTLPHAATREDKQQEQTPEEDFITLYDVCDDLSDQDRFENLDFTPLPITVTEILDAQRIDDFWKEIRSRKDRWTSGFVET